MDDYTKMFNEYVTEHSNILEILKKSEFFQALVEKAEDEDKEALDQLAEQHAEKVQPILDHFLEVMSDPQNAEKMLYKLGRRVEKEK